MQNLFKMKCFSTAKKLFFAARSMLILFFLRTNFSGLIGILLRIAIFLLVGVIFSPEALAAGPGAIPDLDLNTFPIPPAEISAAEIARLELETEENARACDQLLNEIYQKTKEVAREAGVDDDQKLEKIVDAVKYLADVEDLDEEARLPKLLDLKDKISNKDHQTWVEIDREMKRWGSSLA